MIVQIFSCGPVQTNCIVLACEKTKIAAIVDAPMGSMEKIEPFIQKNGIGVQYLLLTHSHWDHIAEVEQVKKKWDIPVCIHSQDVDNLVSPGSDGLPLPLDLPSIEVDRLFRDGEVIELGTLQLRVIHTPGHSPGGICFYIPDENTLISGDTLFRGSIGNLSFPLSNSEDMWGSLKKLSALPASTRVLPGHGPETTIGAESWLADAKNIFGG